MISGDAISGASIGGYEQQNSSAVYNQSISAGMALSTAIDTSIIFDQSIATQISFSTAIAANFLFGGSIGGAMMMSLLFYFNR